MRTLLAVTLVALAVPVPAAAAWTSRTTARSTGTFGMAVASYSFSGGTPASYTISYNVLSFSSTAYPVLTNTGSTAAMFAGPVTPASVPLGSNVTVKTCAAAWSAGTCTGGAATLANAVSLNTPPTVSYQSGTLASGAKSYLQVTVGGFLATATVTLSVASALLPTGGTNRTLG